MGLMSRILGLDDLRQDLHAMMRLLLQVSQTQAETTSRMMATLEALNDVYKVDGPPEGRPGFGDEAEALQWEKDHDDRQQP